MEGSTGEGRSRHQRRLGNRPGDRHHFGEEGANVAINYVGGPEGAISTREAIEHGVEVSMKKMSDMDRPGRFWSPRTCPTSNLWIRCSTECSASMGG